MLQGTGGGGEGGREGERGRGREGGRRVLENEDHKKGKPPTITLSIKPKCMPTIHTQWKLQTIHTCMRIYGVICKAKANNSTTPRTTLFSRKKELTLGLWWLNNNYAEL